MAREPRFYNRFNRFGRFVLWAEWRRQRSPVYFAWVNSNVLHNTGFVVGQPNLPQEIVRMYTKIGKPALPVRSEQNNLSEPYERDD